MDQFIPTWATKLPHDYTIKPDSLNPMNCKHSGKQYTKMGSQW